MNATRLKDCKSKFIRLRLGKGVLLILTLEEYVTALQRGKMERRAARRQAHMAQTETRREADALAWITKA